MRVLYERDRGASTWRFVLKVCEKHDAALEEIVFPKEYTSDVSCRLRRAVLSDLWRNGWGIRKKRDGGFACVGLGMTRCRS
jgi:hypothetical protein